MLLNLEGFQYATPLHLNMGYYCIRLSERASILCTIILPWVKYEYKRLPMGLCNSPYIFQEKMNEIFRGIGFIIAYINDILIITKSDWSGHLNKLKLVLKFLRSNGFKCNIEKSYFGQTEMEYLGFWVTQTGIRPINNKEEAIVNMTSPKNQKQIFSFIVLVDYYRDMWAKQSYLLQPLTALTPNKVNFKWTVVEQKPFDEIKQIVACDNLLIYLDFNKQFDVHIYSIGFQVGLFIRQDSKSIAFYRHKLTGPKTRYTVTEKE